MKIKYLFIIFLNTLLLSCEDDDYPFADVPSVVLNEFRAKYPDATDAEFNRAGDNYEIEFDLAGKENAALINFSGNVLKERKEITWDELPSEVRETLETRFGAKEIKDPEMVRTRKEIYYQAEVKRFLINEKVVLDKTGKRDPGLSYWK